MPSLDVSFLLSLMKIAREAGDCIMTHYKKPLTVEEKKDKTPVTQADKDAEAIITRALSEMESSLPVVAEESFSSTETPDIHDQPFWLVDPLDGTREFLSHNGEFTVNIALIDQGKPVAGVVHAPALSQTYLGSHKIGAFFSQEGNNPSPIRTRSCPDSGISVVASRSHGGGSEMESFLDHLDIGEMKAAGSSLKFCLVACGQADLYPRFGRTMEWDTAAGHAVLMAAGGDVVDATHHHRLRYGKTGFANPYFLAYGGQTPIRAPKL